MKEEDAVNEELVMALRKQKHDFMNHIQVIHAYLQLGKVEKALGYLEKMVRDEETAGRHLIGHACGQKHDRMLGKRE